jgi:tetratricopeptide (TPR) repeat protein
MNTRRVAWLPAAALLIGAVMWTGTLQAQQVCGGSLGQNSWGRPLDYRDPGEQDSLDLVERFHFTRDTENLVKGVNVPLPGDIHYTLMRFVNHYRALNSMATWQLKNGFREGQEYFPADCYFERAAAFTPDDPMVYVIWGNYLFRKKDFPRALEIYGRAEELGPDNAEVHYNLGLLYIEMKDLVRAQEHADKAYSLGYPLPGLRNKLKRLLSAQASAATAPRQP